MIINLQVGKTSPKARVNYLLYGKDGDRDLNAVDILYGNPDLFVRLAEKNPYKTKTYNFLISFAESKEELERKLAERGKTIEELFEEVFSFLLPAEYYQREALNVLAVGHSDTDNYHIHLTIENYDHLNQKSLYIPKNRTEIEFYRALEQYISVKYGLDFEVRERNKGRAGAEKIKEILEERGTYKNKTRDEVKEEITNYLTELVLSGEIESRDDLIAYLQAIEGLEIKRIGKSYISFGYRGQHYRLKGGIYDEQRFREVKEGLERKKPDLKKLAELFETLKRKREESIKKRRKDIRRGAPLPRLETPDIRNDLSPTGEVEELRGPDRKLYRKLQAFNLDIAFPLDWLTVDNNRFSVSSEEREFSSFLQDEENQWKRVSVLQNRRTDLLVEREKVGLSRGKRDTYPYSVAKAKLEDLMKVKEKLKEIRQEELQLLKELDPREVLRALGISDYQEKNGYILLKSPLREEKNPSFQVFYGTERGCWVYMDFGTGWTGTSIDLWQEVRKLGYVDAIREMRETFEINLLENGKDIEKIEEKIRERRNIESQKQKQLRERLKKEENVERKKITHRILEVREPRHPALVNYLRQRGIKEIPDWLKEIRYIYLPNKKHYFALAVKDKNGVWHSRNSYSKLNIITAPDQKPTYTWIDNWNKKAVVVEGLFDALTLLQLTKNRDFDIIILNSTVHTEDLIRDRVLLIYEEIVLALDNDEAGQTAEKKIYEYLKDKEVKIKKIIYSEGKDLNECYLKKGKFEVKEITPRRCERRKEIEQEEVAREIEKRAERDRGGGFSPGM